MTNKAEGTKIEAFWEWFIANEAQIMEILNDDVHPKRDALVRAMDDHILGFGLFTWEMGPISNTSFYLTISPNANKELLEISQSIIASAPQLPHWDFYYAKPVKEGNLILNLYDEDFNEHRINALEWRFVLTSEPNRKTNIIIEAPNMAQLDIETRIEAGNLVISSLLGEEQRIRAVRKIEVVIALDPIHQKLGRPIAQLKEKFEAL